MADSRFFDKINSLTLEQIVSVGEVRAPENADLSRIFKDVAGLAEAGPDDVSWAFIPKAREDLKNTKVAEIAGVIVDVVKYTITQLNLGNKGKN